MRRDINVLALTKRGTTKNEVGVVQYGKKFSHIHFDSGLIVFV